MKLFNHNFIISLVIAMFVVCGCGSDDDNNAAPEGLDLQGTWLGVVFNNSKPGRQNINVTITQDAEAIIINTSKSGAPGKRITGTLSSDNQIRATDNGDASTWTTRFGSVSETSIKLANDLGNNELLIIELFR